MIYALQTVLQIDVTNVTEQVVAAVIAFLITSLLGLFFFLLGRDFSEMKLRGHDHMLWAMAWILLLSNLGPPLLEKEIPLVFTLLFIFVIIILLIRMGFPK